MANSGSGTVSIINTATNTVVVDAAYGQNNVIKTIAVGSRPNGVAVAPDGKQIYVTNSGSGTVSVIDTTSDTVAATVNVGTGPWALGQFISLGLHKNLTPPAVIKATAHKNKITLAYNRILDETSVPAPSDFSVKVNSTPVTVSQVVVLGSRIDLILTAPATAGQTVTLEYTPGLVPVKEMAGLPAAGFTGTNALSFIVINRHLVRFL